MRKRAFFMQAMARPRFQQASDGLPIWRWTIHQGEPVVVQHMEEADMVEFRANAARLRVGIEGDTGHEEPVDEAFQDRWQIEPPLRKDENQPFGGLQPRDQVFRPVRSVGRRHVACALGGGEALVEGLAMERSRKSTVWPPATSAARASAATAAAKLSWQRMGQHDQDPHQKDLP